MFHEDNDVRHTPLTIVPANGWRAVYAYKSPDDGTFAHAHELAVFALVESIVIKHEGGYPKKTNLVYKNIVGYEADASLTPACSAINFLGYLAPDALIPDWQESEARRYVERAVKEREELARQTTIEG